MPLGAPIAAKHAPLGNCCIVFARLLFHFAWLDVCLFFLLVASFYSASVYLNPLAVVPLGLNCITTRMAFLIGWQQKLILVQILCYSNFNSQHRSLFISKPSGRPKIGIYFSVASFWVVDCC